ncbi:outer membrane beta-barrel protein [Paracoccus sp. 1_MG-2023]|uniref:outer membrane protein n=1 Tax=unclassified Paracoccus (in: a-proteobacteria) TaxID=2688777 RepID=UPI001C08C3F6|nr:MULTISPECIES: outer membrane beta-barrel protein [unclassified Paracoccus (in: a-proteobacteria)]MBU2957282.1 outer membrane beta-barrel protein [Paracoccus sp. C2R09]MDO6669169.1 outer membrane beta-barrel protein [Paracoccus sp. 1_MG-2023]
MTFKFRPGGSALAIAIAIGGAAQAGGIAAPSIEATPVIRAPAPVASAWAGGYVGGSLGYVFDTDDQIGLRAFEGDTLLREESGRGDVGIGGLSGGVHAGYRWQRGNWVFGPELSAQFGSVDESRDILLFDTEVDAENEMKGLVALVAKTGYLVDPRTLVYGTFGIARGDFEYSFSSDDGAISKDYSSTGVAAGLGVERLVNDRLSVFAEYQYRDFGNETVDFAFDEFTFDTRASVTQSTVKIGANWRF